MNNLFKIVTELPNYFFIQIVPPTKFLNQTILNSILFPFYFNFNFMLLPAPNVYDHYQNILSGSGICKSKDFDTTERIVTNKTSPLLADTLEIFQHRGGCRSKENKINKDRETLTVFHNTLASHNIYPRDTVFPTQTSANYLKLFRLSIFCDRLSLKSVSKVPLLHFAESI